MGRGSAPTTTAAAAHDGGAPHAVLPPPENGQGEQEGAAVGDHKRSAEADPPRGDPGRESVMKL